MEWRVPPLHPHHLPRHGPDGGRALAASPLYRRFHGTPARRATLVPLDAVPVVPVVPARADQTLRPKRDRDPDPSGGLTRNGSVRMRNVYLVTGGIRVGEERPGDANLDEVPLRINQVSI